MSSAGALLGVRGHLLDAPVWGRLRSVADGALIIGGGKILEMGEYLSLRKKPRDREVRWLDAPGLLVFPGLIDLHTHLPQYLAVGRAEAGLLPWLRQNIFPLEKDFSGPKSHKFAPEFFRELARNGTTTACVYCSVFEDSCDAAFQAAEKSGLRVVMGQMLMDVAAYGTAQPRKVVSIALLESERLCKKWHGAAGGRIEYAFSPRHAPTCSEKMMRGAAELAAANGAYLQTHLAENVEELEKVRNQFMWGKDYTDVYAQCGVLSPKAILGQAIHLSDSERAVVGGSGSAVAHCPTSSFFHGSGAFPLEKMRALGIRLGLGSDVAAGPELSLWRVMRSAVEMQKARGWYEPEVPRFGPVEALHLATQGGAEALGKGDVLGSFDVGKAADFILVDLHALLPYGKNPKLQPALSPEDLLSLAVYRGGPHAMLRTFVGGMEVSRGSEPGLF